MKFMSSLAAESTGTYDEVTTVVPLATCTVSVQVTLAATVVFLPSTGVTG